jgi:hypothetical protein
MALTETLIDASLVLTTCAYAEWLGNHKRLEPDFTWVEVAAGTALCLMTAAVRSRIQDGDWRTYERNVWRAFLLGGAPIIAGELSQWLRRRAERQHYVNQRQ